MGCKLTSKLHHANIKWLDIWSFKPPKAVQLMHVFLWFKPTGPNPICQEQKSLLQESYLLFGFMAVQPWNEQFQRLTAVQPHKPIYSSSTQNEVIYGRSTPKWLGYAVECPPTSPDHTPIVYFLWGYIKWSTNHVPLLFCHSSTENLQQNYAIEENVAISVHSGSQKHCCKVTSIEMNPETRG